MDFILGELMRRVPTNYFNDLADVISLITFLVIIDVITRMTSEVIRYNNDAGYSNTFFNVLLGFMYRGWRELDNKRYLLSKRFLYGICIKCMFIYSIIMAFSFLIYLLPSRIVLFDTHINQTISDILLLTPLVSEWFSIVENIQSISYTQLRVFNYAKDLIKWVIKER